MDWTGSDDGTGSGIGNLATLRGAVARRDEMGWMGSDFVPWAIVSFILVTLNSSSLRSSFFR